jgi:glutamine synthetase
MAPKEEITIERLPELLKDDIGVKVAGIDIDGVLRGKIMAKNKFLSIAQEGFGFCSVIFGWDMHDQTYIKELKISNKENGYRDLLAVPDLQSFRRIPWEKNIPFFLLSFLDPDTGKSVSACPRSLLKRSLAKLEKDGYGAMAGGRLEQKDGLRFAVVVADITKLSLNSSTFGRLQRPILRQKPTLPQLQLSSRAIHLPSCNP